MGPSWGWSRSLVIAWVLAFASVLFFAMSIQGSGSGTTGWPPLVHPVVVVFAVGVVLVGWILVLTAPARSAPVDRTQGRAQVKGSRR